MDIKNIAKGNPKNTMINNKKSGRLVLVCLFWLGMWWGTWALINNPLVFPSPFDVIKALILLTKTGDFYLNGGATLLRCLLSLMLSASIGILLGWQAYKSSSLKAILSFPVGFFKIVPVMAVVIYIILVANSNWVSVIVGFLICFPIIYTNVLTGLEEVPLPYLELGEVFDLSPFAKIRYIYFYSILPHIKSALKVGAGISFKAVVAAEVLAIPDFSIGYQMMDAKYYLETPKLFAYVAVIIALSTILEKIIMLYMEKLIEKTHGKSKIKNGQILTKSREQGGNFQEKIILKNIIKDFGDKKVNIPYMEFTLGVTGISGKSGLGKTTAARIITGLEKDFEGEITGLKNKEVSFLFQEDRLIPWLNVHDNMALSMKKTDDKAIETMAENLEIADNLYDFPQDLSGGMMHRVALGRTFLADRKVMVLDEPFRALDEATKDRIIKNLWEDETKNKIVILISHNPKDVERLSHKVYPWDKQEKKS